MRYGCLVSIFLFVALTPSLARAQGQTTAGVCNGCTTLSQLQARATALANAAVTDFPISGSVYVTSDVALLSATYSYVPKRYPPTLDDPRYYAVLTPITTTVEQGELLDETMFAKTVAPVKVPAEHGPSASSASQIDVGTYVRSVLPIALTMGGYQVLDTRNGARYSIKVGTRITVEFEDGSTAQLVWTNNSASTIVWEWVPGSERDPQGNPYAAAPAPAPLEGREVTFVSRGISYTIRTTRSTCQVVTTVCSGGTCTSRRHFFVCGV